MTYNTHITFVTDILDHAYSNIVWEIQDQGDIDRLGILSITEQQKSILIQNLNKTQKERRQNIFFYHINNNQATLICFFLNKDSLQDDRCDYY